MSSETERSNSPEETSASENILVVLLDAFYHFTNYLTHYVEKFQALSLHGQILTILIAWLIINILFIYVAWKIYGQTICDPKTTGSKSFLLNERFDHNLRKKLFTYDCEQRHMS